MQAEAFHLIFFYFSRKDCSQGEAVGSLVHGPGKMSCGIQVTAIILHLHNETPLFDFLVPSRSSGHLHSGHSFFFLFSRYELLILSISFCMGIECVLQLTHLHCVLSIFPLADLFFLIQPYLNFKLKREYVKLLFLELQFSMLLIGNLFIILYLLF